jgi:hypothetical protein
MIAAWTGVAPKLPAAALAAQPRPPRVPPAIVRALRAVRQ